MRELPEMVVVPPGSFTMGSPVSERGRTYDEGPQHVVTFAKPLAVGKFHVTVEQFAAFVEATGYDAGSRCWGPGGWWSEKQGRSWRDPGFPQNGSQPALCISFNDVHAYVAWLARKTGKAYRLLTESEWEYAARARTEPGAYPRYWFGNEEKDLCRYGNVLDQTAKNEIAGFKDLFAGFKDLKVMPAPCNDGYAYASPVGSFPANGFGVYDMQGNAWTWTEDCYHGNYIGAPSDGSPWTSGDCNNRVLRGASWVDSLWLLRAARSFGWYSIGRASNVGVRVVRTLTP